MDWVWYTRRMGSELGHTAVTGGGRLRQSGEGGRSKIGEVAWSNSLFTPNRNHRYHLPSLLPWQLPPLPYP